MTQATPHRMWCLHGVSHTWCGTLWTSVEVREIFREIYSPRIRRVVHQKTRSQIKKRHSWEFFPLDVTGSKLWRQEMTTNFKPEELPPDLTASFSGKFSDAVCVYTVKHLCFLPWQLIMREFSKRNCSDLGLCLAHGPQLPDPENKAGFPSGHLLLKSTFVICRKWLGKKRKCWKQWSRFKVKPYQQFICWLLEKNTSPQFLNC